MDKFGDVPVDVAALLQSVLKTYTIDAEDLYFKWESWGFRMGNNPPLNIENATLFKEDIQNQLEYANQAKIRDIATTPVSTRKVPHNKSAAYDDFLGGDMTPVRKKIRHEPNTIKKQTPSSTPLRREPHSSQTEGTFDTLATPIIRRIDVAPSTPFDARKDSGSIILTLDPVILDKTRFNADLAAVVTANFDPKKYYFRPMYQKLSEVSEMLDDQIDQYAETILESHALNDEDIGNPSQASQTETIVIGRVVSDSLEGGRLNVSSIMLETSRRLGTGSRARLDLSNLSSFALFPGQLIALRGTQSAAEFKVSEILQPKSLPPSASRRQDFRTGTASVIVAAGPYTPNSDLSFSALRALGDVIAKEKPTSVILTGPFVDLTHPSIKSGDLECEGDSLDAFFQTIIAPIIKDFPGLLIIPHVNDAITRHPCFPQEPFNRQVTGLGKSVKLLPNPALFSLDEVSYGVSSNDILKHLTVAEISRNPSEKNGLTRQALHILQQRRFYPLFPGPASEGSSIANLDIGFAGLTEFGTRLPDILISPSEMTTFAKIVDGVVVINPGGLSKRGGPGTYAQILIQPKDFSTLTHNNGDQESETILNELWNRVKVDIVRI